MNCQRNEPDLPAEAKPHKRRERHRRPDPRPPLVELIELRKKRGYRTVALAELLGVSRLHMTAVEQGRRQPSLELALRWVQILAPEARIEMFGPLPVVEQRIRDLKKLQKISPEFFKAA